MANAHSHRQRVLRGIDDELAREFDDATARAGSNRSAVTRAFWEWYVDRPGSALPARETGEFEGDQGV
jgi:metal-responsive CopG/Arc/MetJ family transcriptional regulator